MTLHDANSGNEIELPASSILVVREYPANQCWVETSDTAMPVIQPSESVEDVERMRKEELSHG